MTAVNVSFELDPAHLPHLDDQHLAAMWHVSQANPAPFGDRDACDFAEHVGREIIRRFLVATPPALWSHQGRHIEQASQLGVLIGDNRGSKVWVRHEERL